MKILFVSHEYPPETGWGGIGSYLANMGPALARRGHDVHVLSCVGGQSESDRLDRGVWVHRRGIKPIRGMGRLFRLSPQFESRLTHGITAFREARRLGIAFDVVEYPEWNGEGWVFALLRTRPTVSHLHTGLSLLAKPGAYPDSYDLRLASWLESLSARHASAVTSPSRLLTDSLAATGWIERSRVTNVPYPIESRLWQGVPPAGSAPPIVQFCGRIERRKAPETLVDAIRILRSELPDVTARFAGKFHPDPVTGLPAMPWTKPRNLDNCEFVGHHPASSLKNLLAGSRVLAQPSLFENFSVAALEAMAAGRPVVVTTTSGVAEIVRAIDPSSVVPPGDAQALATALRPFLADPDYATEIGERERRFVATELDPDRIAALRERVYEGATAAFLDKRIASARSFRNALDQRRAKVPAVWREWAVREAIDEPWKHFYLRDADQVLDLLFRHPRFSGRNDLRGVSILDVGCTPAVSCLLACMGAEVAMLDLNPNEFAKAAEQARLLGVSNRVKLVIGDAFQLPFANGQFDLVWNNGFIEHFDAPELIVSEMKRVARDGAAILVLAPNRWTPHSMWIRERLRRRPGGFYWDWMGRERSYSPSQLQRLMRRCGLTVVASSSANLRRSVLDDNLVLPRLERPLTRNLLFRIMNMTDWIERRMPLTSAIGFMSGVVATAPDRVKAAAPPPDRAARGVIDDARQPAFAIMDASPK